MDVLRELLVRCCCWRKPSRYGYSIIRGRVGSTWNPDNSQISLQSNLISLNKPLAEEQVEEIYDQQDDLIISFQNLKTTRILLEIPSLGRRLTNQLAEFCFSEDDDDNIYANEREDILKQNLLYLASNAQNVHQLAQELVKRKVLRVEDLMVIEAHETILLKALEIFKLVLNQKDSLGFLIGSLKTTGSHFVADVLIGNYHNSDVGSELICKISLTPEFSPELIIKGNCQKYAVLRSISRERQEILTIVNCSFVEFKGKHLLNALEYCKNLTTIKLTDVKLKKDFPRKISLPSLKRFVLHLNKKFSTKKDFFDDVTPRKILNLLFFIKDENNNNNNDTNSLLMDTLTRMGLKNNLENDDDNNFASSSWNIKSIWDLDLDISLKMSGRTVLLMDHVKSRLFSRVENYYKIPENVITPHPVRHICFGWINKLAKSCVPLNLTKLSLYSISSIDSTKNEINVILKHSSHLREFRLWNEMSAEASWPILKFSCLPARLKIVAASFVQIKMDVEEDMISDNKESSSSSCRLDHICLFFYKVQSDDPENERKFLRVVGQCKTVCLIAFPPLEQPNQNQLFEVMRQNGGRIRQIIMVGCQHSLNFDEHWLYFRREVFDSIKSSQSFMLNKTLTDRGWTASPLEKDQVIQYLYVKLGFDILYSYESFVQHEIVTNLWKFLK